MVSAPKDGGHRKQKGGRNHIDGPGIEKAGKSKPPTKSGKKAEPKKTDAEKLKDAKEKLRDKMKEMFGGKDDSDS